MMGDTSINNDSGGGDGGGHTDCWGLIPRAVKTLFEALSAEASSFDKGEGTAGGAFSYSVHCSMLQIYNEQLVRWKGKRGRRVQLG